MQAVLWLGKTGLRAEGLRVRYEGITSITTTTINTIIITIITVITIIITIVITICLGV